MNLECHLKCRCFREGLKYGFSSGAFVIAVLFSLAVKL